MSTAQDVARQVDVGLDSQLQTLKELVAIPSVSSDPTRTEDMWRSARYVRDACAALGLEASIHQAEIPGGMGAPAVIARSCGDPEKPTVLLYAHHDVQPPGDQSRWDSPAFEAQIRGNRIFGRGTSDDGAGIVVHLGAVEALMALDGSLPVNVIVFVEGEEEVGSPSFQNFLTSFREELTADVIIVADSGNWTVDIPAITASLRGVVAMDVSVRVLAHAVHSGFVGGPILDAVTLASRLISTLHDEDGAVAVEGLGGNPRAEVEWAEEDYRRDASVVEGYRLAGRGDLAARVWTMPAINVIGMDATSVADSANTIIPHCTFRLSIRTVPGSNAEETAQAVAAHLLAHAPFGCEVSTSIKELGPSYQANLDREAVKELREALATAWGTEAVAIGQGGSIPFIAQFEEVFPAAEVVVTGVEDPATNAHSENESQSIPVLRNATVAEALLLQRLGEKKRHVGRDH